MLTISKRIALLGAAPLLAASLCMFGCGNTASNSQSAASSTAASSTEASSSVSSSESSSQTSTDESSITVTLKNETGEEIASVAVKASGTSEYSETHTFNGFYLKNGDSADLTFEQIQVEGKPATSYDLQFVTTNDAIMEMPGLDLANLKEVTLKFEDSVGYVEYTDAVSGETVNNKEESEQLVNQNTENITTYDQQNQLG